MAEQTPLTDETRMAAELAAFAAGLHIDREAADRLEAQLMTLPLQAAQNRPVQRRVNWRAWAAAAAILALIVAAFLAVPPLRSLAQDLIDRLFVHAEGDSQSIQFAEVDMNSIQHLTDLDAVDALGDRLGFDVLLPTYLPEGYTFTEALRFPYTLGHVVSLTYQDGNMQLYIDQAPVADRGGTETQVGASAEIVPMTVERGGTAYSASYVQGDWAFPLPEGAPTPAAGAAFSGTGEWRSDIPKRQLVWVEGDMIYQIVCVAVTPQPDPVLISPEDMVRIAEGLK